MNLVLNLLMGSIKVQWVQDRINVARDCLTNVILKSRPEWQNTWELCSVFALAHFVTPAKLVPCPVKWYSSGQFHHLLSLLRCFKRWKTLFSITEHNQLAKLHCCNWTQEGHDKIHLLTRSKDANFGCICCEKDLPQFLLRKMFHFS